MMEALYIEDDLIQQRLMTLYFQDMGIKLHLAGNGTDGLPTARKVLPSFIMADWFLPDLEGATLLRLIEEDTQLQHIPVIVITANPLILHDQHIFAQGAAACLIKPVNKSKIANVIQQILPNWPSAKP